MIDTPGRSWSQHGSGKRARQALRGLGFPQRSPARPRHPVAAPRASLTSWSALALLSLVVAVASPAFSVVAAAAPPLVPDPTLTPGDVLTTDATVVCQPGYTATVRDVPQSLKNQVYRQYGITHRAPREYEIDHLISLELGGSNSLRNLWPQSYRTTPLNAHVKDGLENRLHALVCAGQVSLPAAQHAIATNWVAAYEQYVGPLPQASGAPAPGNAGPSSASPAPAPVSENSPLVPADGSCPAVAPIKATKGGVYHRPEDPYYARSKAIQCFATPQAAQAAGFRAPRR